MALFEPGGYHAEREAEVLAEIEKLRGPIRGVTWRDLYLDAVALRWQQEPEGPLHEILQSLSDENLSTYEALRIADVIADEFEPKEE
jgi:hypothetical protein